MMAQKLFLRTSINRLSQKHYFSEIMSNFEHEFGLDQIIFQITRQRQTNSLVDGQRHEESCLGLVFVDDVGRVHKKVLFSALKVITQQ
jgi:hypothetical protein